MMRCRRCEATTAAPRYCSLHHLLLALAETYPDLKAIAAGMVKDFVAAPENRTKARPANRDDSTGSL